MDVGLRGPRRLRDRLDRSARRKDIAQPIDLVSALRAHRNVLLDAGEGELPKQSVVVVSQIASVEKIRLGERIGSLSQARVEQILAGLRFQQRSFFGA